MRGPRSTPKQYEGECDLLNEGSTWHQSPITAMRYPAKLMRECRSLWHINYLLIKQIDKITVS